MCLPYPCCPMCGKRAMSQYIHKTVRLWAPEQLRRGSEATTCNAHRIAYEGQAAMQFLYTAWQCKAGQCKVRRRQGNAMQVNVGEARQCNANARQDDAVQRSATTCMARHPCMCKQCCNVNAIHNAAAVAPDSTA